MPPSVLGDGPAPAPSPGTAENVFASASPAMATQPPRVTLTIELGSLTLDGIASIAEFVMKALSASPGTAVGAAQWAEQQFASLNAAAGARKKEKPREAGEGTPT